MLKLFAIAIALAIVGGTAATTAQARKEHEDHNWSRLVFECEAKGVRDAWYANTRNGFYFGPQFSPKTWHKYGGGPVQEMGDLHGRPMHSYSVAYIIRVAERTMRGQGPGAWPWCHTHGYI
jgi:hypothetical protein